MNQCATCGLDFASVAASRPSVTSDIYTHLFDQARHAEDIRTRMQHSAFGRLLEELP